MDWHYETLEIYNIYEIDIPCIKETDPLGYEQILYTEFLHCCEDKHYALHFPTWRKENEV